MICVPVWTETGNIFWGHVTLICLKVVDIRALKTLSNTFIINIFFGFVTLMISYLPASCRPTSGCCSPSSNTSTSLCSLTLPSSWDPLLYFTLKSSTLWISVDILNWKIFEQLHRLSVSLSPTALKRKQRGSKTGRVTVQTRQEVSNCQLCTNENNIQQDLKFSYMNVKHWKKFLFVIFPITEIMSFKSAAAVCI